MARQCIGLDIGSSAVKIVQLKVSGRGTVLQNFGIQPVPPQTVVDGSVMNPGAVVDAVRSLAQRIHLRGKEVAVAISGTAAIVKRVTIPHMQGAALDEQIEWEIQQNIPFSRDDVLVDRSILVEQTPAGQMEVLLVAAKKEAVNQYLGVVREAGFQPLVVDTAAFALQNAVEASIGFVPGETIAIINAGAAHSTICIVADGVPVFNRDVASAGNTFTEAIQQRLAVSAEGAEQYKIGGHGSTTADVVPQEVHRVLAQVSDQMAAEIQRSIDFFLSSSASTLARIYLTGGTALVPQLPKAIQDRARIPVEIIDPFVRTQVDSRRFDVEYLRANAPVATIAFGLALRQPGDVE
jgi:type IV pilus assembly protein PilM